MLLAHFDRETNIASYRMPWQAIYQPCFMSIQSAYTVEPPRYGHLGSTAERSSPSRRFVLIHLINPSWGDVTQFYRLCTMKTDGYTVQGVHMKKKRTLRRWVRFPGLRACARTFRCTRWAKTSVPTFFATYSVWLALQLECEFSGSGFSVRSRRQKCMD